MSSVVERFVKYCEIPSQSDPIASDGFKNVPSTPTQFDIAAAIKQDLLDLGALDVEVDEHAYVTAHWPASEGCENLPTLGLCSHMDTAWQSYGSPVHTKIRTYEGGEFVIGTGRDGVDVVISPETNPPLADMVGWEIITTDGTSLLGADDKSGCAEIITMLERLKADPTIPHPPLALAFVPDEEIGHGASLLDLEKFGAAYCYTVDGPTYGGFVYETFNGAEATLKARGLSCHTGTAKDMMINASEIIMQFHAMLPAAERPEYTEKYDGFFYLERMEGNCEQASAAYILRDHDYTKLERRKEIMRQAVDMINKKFGGDYLTLEIEDQYRNMADIVTKPEYSHLIDNARAAFAAVGKEMNCMPLRGGTDGSQLSYRGLPCPSIAGGYYNGHGVLEFIPVKHLEWMVDMLTELVRIFAAQK